MGLHQNGMSQQLQLASDRYEEIENLSAPFFWTSTIISANSDTRLWMRDSSAACLLFTSNNTITYNGWFNVSFGQLRSSKGLLSLRTHGPLNLLERLYWKVPVISCHSLQEFMLSHRTLKTITRTANCFTKDGLIDKIEMQVV